jgi:hypothetical protein
MGRDGATDEKAAGARSPAPLAMKPSSTKTMYLDTSRAAPLDGSELSHWKVSGPQFGSPAAVINLILGP